MPETGTAYPVKPMPILDGTDIDRFWAKVAITANPNLCWDWIGLLRHGRMRYGCFSKNSLTYVASRLSFFINKNIDPQELSVLHSCDNPKCVNPKHLFLGTNTDNYKDKIAKGRQRAMRKGFKKKEEGITRGEDVTIAKLSAKKVLEIRELYANKDKKKGDLKKLAEKFGVAYCTVHRVGKGKYWNHIK